jgi:hypothetical protein
MALDWALDPLDFKACLPPHATPEAAAASLDPLDAAGVLSLPHPASSNAPAASTLIAAPDLLSFT